MPKIVDHDAQRAALAAGAAALFSKYGYSGLGMRKIASELGVSKSALYHYFPTKMDLFAACTALVTQGVQDQADGLTQQGADWTLDAKLSALRALYEELAPQFGGEISLLSDYLRGREAHEIAKDPAMRLANQRYLGLLTQIVGAERAGVVFSLLSGALLRAYFDGGQTGFADIEDGLKRLLEA